MCRSEAVLLARVGGSRLATSVSGTEIPQDAAAVAVLALEAAFRAGKHDSDDIARIGAAANWDAEVLHQAGRAVASSGFGDYQTRRIASELLLDALARTRQASSTGDEESG